MLAEYKQAFQRELEATRDIETAKRRVLHLRARCYPEMEVNTRENILTHLENKVAEAVMGQTEIAFS